MGWTLRYTGHLGLRGPEAPLFRHSARSADPFDQIDRLADLGFAGVQDNYAAFRTPEEQARVAAQAARHGLAMGSFVHDPAHWDQPCWSVEDAEARAALDAALTHSLETAQRIGATVITCVTGRDPHADLLRQRTAMAENLRRAGDRAARAGVKLCVEATAAAWLPGMLVDSLDTAIAIVRAADHPAVRLMFDTGHVAMDGADILTAYRGAQGLIGAVQLADMPRDGSVGRIDVGGGRTDWVPFLNAVRADGYDGLFEIEHEPETDSAEGEARLIARLAGVDRALSGTVGGNPGD